MRIFGEGEWQKGDLTDGGWILPCTKTWKAGDKVELRLDMPVRYSVADSRVEADTNRMCVTRGPLLYCAEDPDNQHTAYMYVLSDTDREERVSVMKGGIMDGIVAIDMDASVLSDKETFVQDVPLRLIPYYAWNNRGDNIAMNVWFARDTTTLLASLPTLTGNIEYVDATHTNINDDVNAIADGRHPSSSSDKSIPRWTSWNKRGRSQKVTISLKGPQDIESVSVYWCEDDKGVGVPESWTMDYLEDGQWKTFEPYITDRFGIEKDQFNMVHPAGPTRAEALRLNIKPQEDKVVGILEVVIE